MNKYLRMVFRTDQDKLVSLRVGVPREDLEASEVKDVMETIIQKNAIYSKAGELVAIDSAYIVQTDTTALDLQP